MSELLNKIKQEYDEIVNGRKKGGKYKQVLVCCGSACQCNDGLKMYDYFKELCKDMPEISVVSPGCFGLCAEGPHAVVYPDETLYGKLTLEKVERIVKEHLQNNTIPLDLCYNVKDGKLTEINDMPFFKKQRRVVLHNCGIINPNKIEEYIARNGYYALEKCLTELTPKEIIETVKASGLRGRGGGGFPTGKKWEMTANSKGDIKYVCCNGDEGDPGAFMDRSIMESDPHSVIEAMIIAGYAIGAHKGYIYVRAEYSHVVVVLRNAIKQAKELGLLGKNILGSGFDFDIEMNLGAGVFVCGEETALMTSIEGHRGEPHTRPPYPAVKGLFAKPTLLNNVETYSNIPQIILNGAEWFSSMGTAGSKGTKVFSLGGKINNTGLVEVPMGITLKEMIYEIGGGIPNNKSLKAVQTGGPSGGCLPSSKQDVQVDYDNLIANGSMMGSGGMIVMDEDTCMVDIAKFFMDFMVKESCGKCVPCRIGTKRMLEILEKITKGEGSEEDLEKLKELCFQVRQNSLCGLGQTAPNPIMSTMNCFYDEYLDHVKNKKCSSGVCEKLRKFEIDETKCKGCSLCAINCPVKAISGEVGKTFRIDNTKCIKCGLCYKNCKFNAIKKV